MSQTGENKRDKHQQIGMVHFCFQLTNHWSWNSHLLNRFIRRLELRFRPDDVFCKPTCGERNSDSSFLIKVKRRRLKPGVKSTEQKPAEKCDVKVVGLVSDCFKFNNLCDFQYLPMVYNQEDKSHSDIYSQVYPGNNKLASNTWLYQDAPLFIPPAAFSRMDLPQDYQFRNRWKRDSMGNQKE